MGQYCNWDGTLMFDPKYEINEKTGKPRAYFKVKCPANYSKPGEERFDIIAFEAWGDTADFCATLNSGDMVVIVGRVGSYSVTKGDATEYRLKVTAEKVLKLEAPAE